MLQAAPEGFIDQAEKAVEKWGIAFVGPLLAADVASGNMESFTKLVEEIRARS